MAEKKYVDNNGLLYVWQKIKTKLSGKVDTVEGKGLSTNDYTTAEKNKLAGLNNYELPTASADTLGGVKVGAGLEINSGVLSATGGGTADAVDWSNVQNKPTSLSEFTNDSNYQTANDVTSAINTALANINKKEVVASTAEMTDANTIYLMPNAGNGNNVYDEYILVNGTAEKVGTTEVDLTNYLQNSDLVAITNSEIDALFSEE